MNTVQFMAPLLLEAVIGSLLLGAVCWLLLRLLFRAFPKSSSAARFLLCNLAQLALLAAFLHPFLEAVFQEAGTAVSRSAATSNPARLLVSMITSPHTAAGSPAAADPQAAAGAPGGWLTQAYRWIVWGYLAGLLVFVLRFVNGYLGMRRLKRDGLSSADAHWLSAFHRAKARLGIRRTVRVAFSSLAGSPCIIGWARALVLVPVSLAGRLSPEQAEAILLHELAHYRQLHHYLNIAAQAVATILFFNPFVWLLNRDAGRYREWSCDELAADCSGNEVVAEALLQLAERTGRSNRFALALRQKRSPFFHRIQNLLYMKSSPVSSCGLLLSFLVLGLSAWAGIARSGTPKRAMQQLKEAAAVGVAAAAAGPAPQTAGEARDAASTGDEIAASAAAPAAAAPDSLQVISQLMQAEGNFNFLVVEALRDSLIHFDAPLDIAYAGKQILIDKKPVPEPYQSRYLAMLKRLPGADQTSYWSTRTDRLRESELYDPKSNYREPQELASVLRRKSFSLIDTILVQSNMQALRMHLLGKRDPAQPSSAENERLLKTMIHRDGLADTSKRITLHYDEKGIFINGRKLEQATEARYEKVLRERFTDIRPRQKGKSSFELIYVPDGEQY